MKRIFDKLNKKEQILYVLLALALIIFGIFFINLYLNDSLIKSKYNLQKANQLLSDVENSIEFSSNIKNKIDQPGVVATSVISSTSARFNVVIDSIQSNDQNEVLVSINTVNFNDLYRWLKSLEVNSKIITVKASLRRNQLIKAKQESVRVQLVLVSRQ
jgi:type II secretory pathway component PulM